MDGWERLRRDEEQVQIGGTEIMHRPFKSFIFDGSVFN
jgi:hypothetical protein